MPKGVPNTKQAADGQTTRKLTIVLHEEDHAALQALAFEQYRTPDLQAAWLLAKVLSEAGRTPPLLTPGPTHAQRIIERAEARANGA